MQEKEMNPSSPYSNDSLENSLASQRIPKCARCRCHGINSELKGHKERCQFKDCECRLCLMVVERQKITAVRVAHLRHQRKVDKQRSSKYYTRYAPLSEEEDYVLSNYGGNEQARKHRMLAYDYPQYRHYNETPYTHPWYHRENYEAQSNAYRWRSESQHPRSFPYRARPDSHHYCSCSSCESGKHQKSHAGHGATLGVPHGAPQVAMPTSPVYDRQPIQQHSTVKCEEREIIPEERRSSPAEERRSSPEERRSSPEERRISPEERRSSPEERRSSPAEERRISPEERRISPEERRISPEERRISPEERRNSPEERRTSPEERRISPEERRVSPEERRSSPKKPRAQETRDDDMNNNYDKDDAQNEQKRNGLIRGKCWEVLSLMFPDLDAGLVRHASEKASYNIQLAVEYLLGKKKQLMERDERKSAFSNYKPRDTPVPCACCYTKPVPKSLYTMERRDGPDNGSSHIYAGLSSVKHTMH